MKDEKKNLNCETVKCKYYDDKMELHCSYSDDNSRCVDIMPQLSSSGSAGVSQAEGGAVSQLQKLQDDVAEWGSNTFGNSGHARLIAIIHHLKKEVQELLESPYSGMEYADCLTLLLDAAKMAGFNTDDLIRVSFDKLEINKTRKWGSPDKNGVCEHING